MKYRLLLTHSDGSIESLSFPNKWKSYRFGHKPEVGEWETLKLGPEGEHYHIACKITKVQRIGLIGPLEVFLGPEKLECNCDCYEEALEALRTSLETPSNT